MIPLFPHTPITPWPAACRDVEGCLGRPRLAASHNPWKTLRVSHSPTAYGCGDLAPTTLDEAVGAYAAAAGAARILAGGTDLLVQMRSGFVRPGLIVDIKKITEVTSVTETDDGGFVVGAAVAGAVLEEHKRFGAVWPGVLEALNLIGSTQIQGRASLGGNLCNGSPAGDSVPALYAGPSRTTSPTDSGPISTPTW